MKKPEDPIRINDEEFEFDDLPEMAQLSIMAIQTIDGQLNNLSSQMEMIQMARSGYMQRLNSVIQEHKNAKESAPEEGVQPQSAVS